MTSNEKKKLVNELIDAEREYAPATFYGMEDEDEFTEIKKRIDKISEILESNGVSDEYIDLIKDYASYFELEDDGAVYNYVKEELEKIVNSLDQVA